MYLPESFAESRPQVLHALMRAHPFATLVVPAPGGAPVVDHVPLLLETEGAGAVLRGHVARANALWRMLDARPESVAVFCGPQGYVTPNWYATKREHGRVVPTWNYAVVHAHGRLQAVDDVQWLRALVGRLTAAHEAGRPSPWRVEDAPADHVERELRGIVGLELPIERLVGKVKASQNRSPADRAGVAAGLRARGSDAERALADLVDRGPEK